MADRWLEDRDRQFRDRDLRRGPDDRTDHDARREDRSFRGGFGAPGMDRGPAQGRVFGERETGADYGRGRRGPEVGRMGGGYGGYGPSGFGRGPNMADESGDWDPRDLTDQGRARAGGYDRSYGIHRGGRASPGGTGGYDYERGYGDGGERGWRDEAPRGDFLSRAGEKISSWFGGGDSEGSHRGRGPKGYKRSDARIDEDIHERLTEDHWLDATDIEVKVANGEVTLSGTVSSRDAKRRAEEISERASGVDHVQNNLRVQNSGDMATSGQSGPAAGEAPSMMEGSVSTAPTATSKKYS